MGNGQTDYGDKIVSLTAGDIEAIADRLVEKMRGPLWVEDLTHHEHHQWVNVQMDAEHQARESRRKVIENVVGAVATAGFLGGVGFIGKLVIDFLVNFADKLPPGAP